MEGVSLPWELWEIILAKLNTEELAKLKQVCSLWNVLIFKIARRRAQLKIWQARNLVFEDFFCVEKVFGRNLLKNTHFTSGTETVRFKENRFNKITKSLTHWQTIEEWKADWVIERPPVCTLGEIPMHVLRAEGVHSMRRLTCIANDCRKGNRQYQEVRLADLGVTDNVMDRLRPEIIVQEWIGVRYDCGCKFSIWLDVFSQSYQLLARKRVDLVIPPRTSSQWRKVSFGVRDYGPGARIVRFSHSGSDSIFLSGYYGSKFALPSVSLALKQF